MNYKMNIEKQCFPTVSNSTENSCTHIHKHTMPAKDFL